MPLVQMTPAGLAAYMGAIKTYLTTAPGYKVMLFQSNTNPTPQSVLADFTEADFTGYAAITLNSLVGPARDPSGGFRVYNDVGWQQLDNTISNTIYGFFVTDHAGALISAYRFANPVNMVDQYSSISFQIEWLLTQTGIQGSSEPN